MVDVSTAGVLTMVKGGVIACLAALSKVARPLKHEQPLSGHSGSCERVGVAVVTGRLDGRCTCGTEFPFKPPFPQVRE